MPVAEQALILHVTYDGTTHDATFTYQSTIYHEQSNVSYVDQLTSSPISIVTIPSSPGAVRLLYASELQTVFE